MRCQVSGSERSVARDSFLTETSPHPSSNEALAVATQCPGLVRPDADLSPVVVRALGEPRQSANAAVVDHDGSLSRQHVLPDLPEDPLGERPLGGARDELGRWQEGWTMQHGKDEG